MKKWLEQQGASFQPGKGSHLKVFLNGKQSTLPMHGTAELGKGLETAIKRQLGINFTAPRGGVLGSLSPKKGRPKGRGIYPP